MFASSANIIGSSTENAFLRSLTNNKNSSGHKIEPCGTPHFTHNIRFYYLHQF